MGNQRGLGLYLSFVCVFLVAAINTLKCLGAGSISVSVVCSEQERRALLNFKHSVKDDFKMLSSWVGNNCCLWEGIICDSSTGSVDGLHLRGDYYGDEGYLVGDEVKSCLAELSHLNYLDLSGNNFGGSRIPHFIGSFKHLTYLNLSNAWFQGIVPHHIGNLSNLMVLDLSQNIDLRTDDMSWTSGLSSLDHLDLSRLNLSQAKNLDMVLYMIPSLKELSLWDCGLTNADVGFFLNSSGIHPNLKHLDLGFNYFNGLPLFLHNMTSLAFLDLSYTPSFAWNFATLVNMIPSLSELHLSSCRLDKTFLSSPHLNTSTLSNIEHLALRENFIEGIFPSVFTNMSSLRVLDLSKNQLSSSIPVMPNLQELDISFNHFEQIEHIGIWRQCHLKQLSASYSHLNIEMIGSPENVSECAHYALERLDLGWNLNGTIRETLGRLANLRRLDLRGSSLTGPIPQSLGRLSFLEVLHLSDNQLTGTIPTFLGQLSKLDLSNNQLMGPIPTFFGKLSELDLSSNQLNGSIPESIGNLAALTHLNLGSNRLNGPIPASLGRLVSLQDFSVYSNMLNGTVLVSVGQLAKLHTLDISYNSLEGVVSEAHFANLSMLKYLDASYNSKLTFNVSPEWIPPFQLLTLVLSSCKIANGFPQWLQNQMKLVSLELSNTTISGPLPTWLRKMPIIPYLDLSHNKLMGPLTNLPNEATLPLFDVPPSRKVLLLENNLFNESIPRSLCRMIDLKILDLSRNRLTGKIPECLGYLQSLFVMIFSSNRLSGVIPSSMALNLSSLLWLSLNDNKLSGELPREMGNLQNLEVLDLGDNSFSGCIPKWIGINFTNLVVLRLHKNNFTGRIPGSLCKTSRLHILDVAYNKLTGTIPRCLGELDAMVKSITTLDLPYVSSSAIVIQVMKGVDLEYTTTLGLVFNMDLSCNRLVGEIPVKLTRLSMLVGLNLSNNHLIGGIPDDIGNMTALFSLDLSGNQLSGTIPQSMAALTFLSHLNLPDNNLRGQIPTGNQLQTLTDPSIYARNKGLCGPPLPNKCSKDEDPPTGSKKKEEAGDDETKEWLFYLDIMSGFGTGFWGVIGVLLFKKQWRWKLFMFAEEAMDRIYVVVMVRVAKIKRVRQAPENASNYINE